MSILNNYNIPILNEITSQNSRALTVLPKLEVSNYVQKYKDVSNNIFSSSPTSSAMFMEEEETRYTMYTERSKFVLVLCDNNFDIFVSQCKRTHFLKSALFEELNEVLEKRRSPLLFIKETDDVNYFEFDE